MHIRIIAVPVSILLALTLAACSSGSNSDDASGTETSIIITEESDAPLIVEAGLEVDPGDANTMLAQSDFSAPGNALQTTDAEDRGDLLPAVFPTETGVDLAYAQAGAELIRSFNEALALPADIAVNFIDCGTANAFYAPPGFNVATGIVAEGGAIILCHELTASFASVFDTADQSFAVSVFVLMHEIGHALVNQLNLPVLGIEESYVDGIAAVLVGESNMAESAALAGWFFSQQPFTPFFDTHRAGPQRLGDLVCWGIGADDLLREQDPLIAGIADQIIASGRDCVGEYSRQVEALQTVLGPYVRGGLGFN